MSLASGESDEQSAKKKKLAEQIVEMEVNGCVCQMLVPGKRSAQSDLAVALAADQLNAVLGYLEKDCDQLKHAMKRKYEASGRYQKRSRSKMKKVKKIRTFQSCKHGQPEDGENGRLSCENEKGHSFPNQFFSLQWLMLAFQLLQREAFSLHGSWSKPSACMAHVLFQPAMAHDSFCLQPYLAHVNCLAFSHGWLHSWRHFLCDKSCMCWQMTDASA